MSKVNKDTVKTVLGRVTIITGPAPEQIAHLPGTPVTLPVEEAEALIARGLAEAAPKVHETPRKANDPAVPDEPDEAG